MTLFEMFLQYQYLKITEIFILSPIHQGNRSRQNRVKSFVFVKNVIVKLHYTSWNQLLNQS